MKWNLGGQYLEGEDVRLRLEVSVKMGEWKVEGKYRDNFSLKFPIQASCLLLINNSIDEYSSKTEVNEKKENRKSR
jgi:hypothetical protein